MTTMTMMTKGPTVQKDDAIMIPLEKVVVMVIMAMTTMMTVTLMTIGQG